MSPRDASPPVLRAEGLVKAFGGIRAVDGVDLSLDAGTISALIGPNGAGKTTCFHLLAGQLRPDAGRLWLDGRDISRLEPHRRAALGLARTFQIAGVFPSLSLADNLALAAEAPRRPRPGLRRRAAPDAATLLARVGLDLDPGRPAAGLSYGQVKRLELAMALAGRPRLLLMDEPTAGLDGPERDRLLGLVAGQVAEQGLTVLFTEHDVAAVFAHAGRVLAMADGRLIADGPPAAVAADPAVQRLYLGRPSTGSATGFAPSGQDV
ncbi:ABC transporter ATP-binding protein [Roseospirillum parvum]|uniref:Branched-chain amino acid transport system ATP-binding protein n=1 Tax=Roseospirillum parvum TaxID=83401 RepID=A0A1G7U3F3_9PROT|nr:ABC transporter ATP-binding protein [Roseospirillum parvum]SDG42165.1 branched-chain amino acid transport system ATP-binding protein [Roseospirillum parvum]